MAAIPLTLLTGFLGSGKTTLLNSLLKKAELTDTAVLINEFGAVGLDHHLVETALVDTVVLDGGCVCCTVRGALSDALRTLYWQRHNGKVPSFKRLILETTGLANPAPLLNELREHTAILQHYRLAGVIVCIDGVFGGEQLDCHPEAVQQAAVADRLLITKTDLISSHQLDALLARLKTINPGAEIVLIDKGQTSADIIVDTETFDPLSKNLDVQQWLSAEKYRRVEARPASGFPRKAPTHQDANRHGSDIQAFCLSYDRPLPLQALVSALQVIGADRGQDLLRLKGIIDVEGSDKPLVIHGVQNMLFPTTTLDAWPDGPRQSRLVFIVRSTEVNSIAETLNNFFHTPNTAY